MTAVPRSRKGVALAAIILVFALGLVSCGRRTTGVVVDEGEVPRMAVYHGVFVIASSGPVLIPRNIRHGAISISIAESRHAPRSAPGPGSEAETTIDSAVVQLVTDDGRSSFPARFDRSTGSLSVSGVRWLSCNMTNGRFEGRNGVHAFIIIPATGETIRAYGGSWSGTTPSGEDFGRLGILIQGSKVIGLAINVVDGTYDRVEGSSSREDRVVLTMPGYTLTGITSRYAVFGTYEAIFDGRRSGSWSVGPLSF